MLHETIRKARRAREMSQKMLAELVGINVKSINQFEQGKQGLRKKNLDRIFEILEIKL
jgi:ribosome-binding protein aMBF1 (putative translation factor)